MEASAQSVEICTIEMRGVHGPSYTHSMPASILLADAYVHDLDPVLLPIGGAFAIRWYGLSYLAGFVVGFLILKWMAKTARIAVPGERVFDLIIYGVGGVLIGGRLGYAIFYQPSLFIELTDSPPFWGLLAINDGGMASHGGIIGVMLAMAIFAWRTKIPWPHIMDCVAFICPPGLFFGRLANFVNGELWGKRLPGEMQGEAAPWWGVQYPAEIPNLAIENPALLIRAVEIPEAIGVTPGEWQRIIETCDRSDESIALLHRWVDRIIEQVREGNQELIDALQSVLTAFYPSQLIQAAAEGVVLFLILAIVWLRPVRPGVIGTSFLAAYGILRILTEVFRQPDEGVPILLGLQRGQLLSVVMLIGFCIAVACVLIRREPRLGGLLKPSPETAALQERARGLAPPSDERR